MKKLKKKDVKQILKKCTVVKSVMIRDARMFSESINEKKKKIKIKKFVNMLNKKIKELE